MKQLSLAFTEDYDKLPENSFGRHATLLLVKKISIEKQTQALKGYDSKIRNETRYYHLGEQGDFLFLLFDLDGTLFTTIRPHNDQKQTYYTANIGNPFLLEKREPKKYAPRKTSITTTNTIKQHGEQINVEIGE